MTTRHRRARTAARSAAISTALAISLFSACTETDDDGEDGDQLNAPVILATEATVTLRTRLQNRYIAAQNNGGGAVTAVATAAQAWETFTLVDENNGALTSGDIVGLRAGNGQYLQAVNGGGSTVNVTGAALLDWERFRIFKQGGGQIHSGDTIALQTIVSGRWLSAENGGGSTVSANGPAYDTWEQLIITLGGAPPPPPPTNWRLVWQDEFDGPNIDESKWVYEVQRPGWVNNELQNYTYRRWENARIENGALVIEARRDFFGGEYSSARLKTQGRVSWTYGRVEARLQVPNGWGTWPAFWMMPDNQSRGWPACGEIDIMEHVGYDENRIHSTTHSLRYNWRSPNQRTGSTFVPGATSGFHVYAVEWYPDRIDAFVDGVRYFTSPNDGGGDDSYPFNKNFHIILNLAVGGDWGGARGVDPNTWPRRMTVDYVRVYQR
jgi:beta-glucanase (GH16 family)